jgi:hypothetical protein
MLGGPKQIARIETLQLWWGDRSSRFPTLPGVQRSILSDLLLPIIPQRQLSSILSSTKPPQVTPPMRRAFSQLATPSSGSTCLTACQELGGFVASKNQGVANSILMDILVDSHDSPLIQSRHLPQELLSCTPIGGLCLVGIEFNSILDAISSKLLQELPIVQPGQVLAENIQLCTDIHSKS